MKIVLATFGSRGDVQPMLALSLALKSEGHKVLLAGPPEKADWAKQLGCPFHPFGRNITSFLDSLKDAHSFHSGIHFFNYMRSEISVQFKALPEIIAGADLVVGASLAIALPTVAESMGIPYRYVAFTPQIIPSSYHPFVVFKYQKFPRCYNRMTWRAIRLFDKFNLTWVINRKRRLLGLEPIQDAWHNILGQRVIVASDTEVAKVAPDVELDFIQTGYMHLNQSDQHVPDLEAFLEAGQPPVYAGFGSMPVQDQARNVPMIVDAARKAGQRVVIGKFWDEPSEYSGSDDVFFISKYPHLKLFPRMAAVIHHGGAGTTASSAISGVPQLIIPHVLDQYYWGHQVYESGLGSKPIWRSRLSEKKLAAGIQECVSNEKIRERVKAVSGIIRQRDSLKVAVSEILGKH